MGRQELNAFFCGRADRGEVKRFFQLLAGDGPKAAGASDSSSATMRLSLARTPFRKSGIVAAWHPPEFSFYET